MDSGIGGDMPVVNTRDEQIKLNTTPTNSVLPLTSHTNLTSTTTAPATTWSPLWPPRRQGVKRRIPAEIVVESGSDAPKIARLSLDDGRKIQQRRRMRGGGGGGGGGGGSSSTVEMNSMVDGEIDGDEDGESSTGSVSSSDAALLSNRTTSSSHYDGSRGRGFSAAQRYAGYEGRGHFDEEADGWRSVLDNSATRKFPRVQKSVRFQQRGGFGETGDLLLGREEGRTPLERRPDSMSRAALRAAALHRTTYKDETEEEEAQESDEDEAELQLAICELCSLPRVPPRVPGMAMDIISSGDSCACGGILKLRIDPRAAAFLAQTRSEVREIVRESSSSSSSFARSIILGAELNDTGSSWRQSAPSTALIVYSPKLDFQIPATPLTVPRPLSSYLPTVDFPSHTLPLPPATTTTTANTADMMTTMMPVEMVDENPVPLVKHRETISSQGGGGGDPDMLSGFVGRARVTPNKLMG